MKFIDFFAGIGGFRRGMELSGHECVGFCEFDKYAVMSYTSMHLITDQQREYLATLPLKQRQKEILKEEYRNGEWYANDIRDVHAGNIPRADCWCAGFPCFEEGTLILTKDGYKNIEDVRVGDHVLTHRGNWKRVTRTMSRDGAEIWNITGFGILPTRTTSEHPYYVTKDGKKFDFVKCSELGDYGKSYSTMVLPEVTNEDTHTEEWWWLAGRYVADGWRVARKGRKNGRTVIACCNNKKDKLAERIRAAGFNYTLDNGATCSKFIITKGKFYEDTEIFGKYAHGKRIPGCVLELPKEKAEQFYLGYMSGDGRNDREEATTTSPYLLLGMCAVAQRIGREVPAVYRSERPGKCYIQGREVNQRTTYTFRIARKSRNGFYSEDGKYACRLLKLPQRSNDVAKVYNISVEDDESYIANGAIVHNCQDISVAGKQLGFDGNRSSLYFQIIRIAEELKEEDRPEWIFLENVKNLLSVNNGWDFARVLFALDEVGYDIEWGVLNSKDFYVPQNRERVFIVGNLRTRGRREVFPVEGASGENRIQLIGHRNGYRRNMQTYSTDGITEALDTASGGSREFHVALPTFVDMHSGGGLELMEKANCIKARYDSGVSNFKHDNSGVAIPIMASRTNGIRETDVGGVLDG